MSLDSALVHLYKVLRNHQAHADPLTVHHSSPFQFAKVLEQLMHVLTLDAFSIVYHLAKQHLFLTFVGH